MATNVAFSKKNSAAPLKTRIDSVSYAFGLAFAGQILETVAEFPSDEFAYNKFAEGLYDGVLKKASMGNDECEKIIESYFQEIQAQKEAEMTVLCDKNEAEGTKFMEENSKKEGVVTTPSGLQYKVVTEGSGIRPTERDYVTFNYKGTFINGEVFDESEEPVSSPCDVFVKGFVEVLCLMQVGSKVQVYIPSHLAFGKEGTPDGSIEPCMTLIFDIELLNVEPLPDRDVNYQDKIIDMPVDDNNND